MNYENFSSNEDGREMLLTLFVGAIGPEATVESITDYFEKFGKVNKVKIIVDWATKQSKDCALVYFTSQESVIRVLKSPKHVINGRVVRVEPADRTKKGTKVMEESVILVSNIDYFTLHGEVIEYFSTFGQITSCKFFNDRWAEGNLKHALIHFEKAQSLSRVLNFGATHVVKGKNVSCSLHSGVPTQGSIVEEHDYAQLQSVNAHSDFHAKKSHLQNHISHSNFQKSLNPPSPTLPRSIDGYKAGIGALNQSHVTTEQKNFAAVTEILPANTIAQLPDPPQKSFNTTKVNSFLFPLEHEKDTLFSVFCDFPRPPPSPRVRWEDTPYSKLPPGKPRKKF